MTATAVVCLNRRCTSARVLCAAVTSLPPGKEARVEVFASGGTHVENVPVLFEKSVKLAAHKGLVAQNALYPDTRHVKDVMVLNTTNQYVILNPNDTLGVLSEACGAVMFPNMNQHSLDTPLEATPTEVGVSQVPDHLKSMHEKALKNASCDAEKEIDYSLNS